MVAALIHLALAYKNPDSVLKTTTLSILSLALLVGGCGGGETVTIDSTQPNTAYVEGELLVKFKSGVAQTQAGHIHGWVAATAVEPLGLGIERISLPPDLSVESAQQLYQASPAVAYAEPNYRLRMLETIPNDPGPEFLKQWAHRNSGQDIRGLVGTVGADISSTLAWDLHQGDNSVIVAVIDSGADYLHPDLRANIWSNPDEIPDNGLDDDGNGYRDDVRGWNFVSNNNDPMDDSVDKNGAPLGHGSHVAGIIGAVGNNGLGVSGINWSVRIMPLKFFDARGDGTTADAIKAIEYAVAKGAKVINASYGGLLIDGQPCGTENSQLQATAIAAAGAAGALFVAAASNDGCNNDDFPSYPASYRLPNLLAVAASDPDDYLAWFSNYGPGSVHLAAPGVDIYSTVRQNKYGFLTGTSMATPMVSGLAALLMSYKPTLGMQAVRETLLKSVDSKASLADKISSGGRINAHAALTLDLGTATPFQPSNVTTTRQGSNSVRIDWLDNSGLETGMALERRVGGSGDFSSLASLPADSQSHTDSTVSGEEGSRYDYRLKASNSLGDSPYSNTASAIVKLHTPTQFDFSSDNAGHITLTWQDQSSVETRYEIERKKNGGGYAKIGQTSANAETYVDTLSASGTYTYRVRASNSNASSDYSNTKTFGISFESNKKCFIATAAYGAAWQPEVLTLRHFRDQYLLDNTVGRAFVRFYYWISPPLANLIAQHDSLRAATRALLTPVVWGATLAMAQKPPARPSHQQALVNDELLVKFKAGTTRQQAEALIARQGDSVLDFISGIEVFHIRIRPGQTLEQALKDYAALAQVQYAEPNMRVRAQTP